MSRKHQKMLVLITMWIMGIGMLTISFSPVSDEESIPANLILTVTPQAALASTTPTKVPTKAPTATPTVTPVPVDPTLLKLNSDIKLNNLVHTYYTALIEVDEETLTSVVTDPSVIKIDQISKTQEYIEDYLNILCYTKPGIKEGDYVVYVTYDMKITTIDTPAPSVDHLYVTTVDNKYLLSTDSLNDEELSLLKGYDSASDVIELVQKVNTKLKDAQAADSDLNEFIQNLTNSLSGSQRSESEDSEESDESEDEN